MMARYTPAGPADADRFYTSEDANAARKLLLARRLIEAGVRCVVFGGRVVEGDAVALSGDPARAGDDLVELGERLGRLVAGGGRGGVGGA